MFGIYRLVGFCKNQSVIFLIKLLGMKKMKVNILMGMVMPLLIIVLWEILVFVDVLPVQSIARPSAAFIKLIEMVFRMDYWEHITISLYRLLIGFSIGCFLGIILGGIVGYWRVAAKVIEPSILTLIPVPPMAWIPFFVALLGIGDLTKVVLISVGSFSMLFIATSTGIRNIDNRFIELAQVFKKKEYEIIRYVILPNTLKYILADVRIAMALSWTLLLAGEIINSSSGIGWLIWDARRFYRSEEMIVGIFTIGVLGKLSDYFISKLHAYYVKWV